MATVRIAGENAADVPVQVIAPTSFPGPPASCPNGLPPADSVASLGANGILGIGMFVQDCGSACVVGGSSNPGFYYSCSSSGCAVTTEKLPNQVRNPVADFRADNNGVLIELPAVGAQGAVTASGSMIFGIGTQPDNGLDGAQVYTPDNRGNFTTVYAGKSYPASFIDSGSNGVYFLSSSATGIAQCSSNAGFYCPPKTVTLNAENLGSNGASGSVVFSIANAEKLFSTGNAAFNDLGGPDAGAFDWGYLSSMAGKFSSR